MKHVAYLLIFFFYLLSLKYLGQSAPDIKWAKSFGGSEDDSGYSLDVTTDGGFILAGNTLSTDIDVENNHGDMDAWIIRLDASGNLLWKQCYGGTQEDE